MHKTEYAIVKFLFWLFNTMSPKGGKRTAYILYLLVARVIRYRKKVILDNLYRVYGDNLPDDKRVLLKNIYKNFVYLWMEFLQMGQLSKENLSDHFHFHNLEIVDKAINEGKGLILLSGHFGNFEWEAAAMAILGYPIVGIAKKQSNPYVDKLIFENRTKYGSKIIYTKNAVKGGLRALRENEILCSIADQDARKAGVFVGFLGQPSSTAIGPAIFRLRSGAPFIFTVSVRRDYGRFDVYFEEILISPTDDVLSITQKHSDMLEKWIRRYPEQWFWVHKRWKTKPPVADMPAKNKKEPVESDGSA